MFIRTADGSRLRVATSNSKYLPATSGSYSTTKMRVEGQFLDVARFAPVANWCITISLDDVDGFNVDYVEGVDVEGEGILDQITWEEVNATLDAYIAQPIRRYLQVVREAMQDHIDNDQMSMIRGLIA